MRNINFDWENFEKGKIAVKCGDVNAVDNFLLCASVKNIHLSPFCHPYTALKNAYLVIEKAVNEEDMAKTILIKYAVDMDIEEYEVVQWDDFMKSKKEYKVTVSIKIEKEIELYAKNAKEAKELVSAAFINNQCPCQKIEGVTIKTIKRK